MLLTYDQIAAYTKADVVIPPADKECAARAITWDSREVVSGGAYLAIPGARVDGHGFIPATIEAGATVIIASHEVSEEARTVVRAAGAALLQVVDSAQALTDLARGWRSHLRGRVIGVTGSVGKTTTKNLVRDVLAAHFSVVATKANQNNELGVPRTLLAADADTQMVVVEMGMRGRGQLESLCSFVRPDWGLVTNVGESHIELLGSRENIARAKGELVAALPTDGMAFLNAADDESGFLWKESHPRCSRMLFDGSGSFDETAHDSWYAVPAVWAEDAELDHEGRARFVLCARGFGRGVERVMCALSLRGLHNVSNAVSAAAVALVAGMEINDVARALATSKPESGRQALEESPAGYLVMDDAYNASPDSMRASLATLDALSVTGERWAVLGDMGELGDFAHEAHERVGAFVAASQVRHLVCIGPLSAAIAEGARKAGFPADAIFETRSREVACAYLKQQLAPGDTVLVKASHSMELDRLAKELVR